MDNFTLWVEDRKQQYYEDHQATLTHMILSDSEYVEYVNWIENNKDWFLPSEKGDFLKLTHKNNIRGHECLGSMTGVHLYIPEEIDNG